MRAEGLIGTAILALLDAEDLWHLRCAEVFPNDFETCRIPGRRRFDIVPPR